MVFWPSTVVVHSMRCQPSLRAQYSAAARERAGGGQSGLGVARSMMYDPHWPWHAAARLGAQVEAPRQYWRSAPRGVGDLFVGAKIGEERDVNVKFPEEYHAKELAGKDATFKCTIRSIKTKELPAIDDELAKKVSKFQTLDELKADIRKNLEENAERTAENDQKSAAIEMATNNITVDIPAVMIDNRVTAMIQEMAMRLEQQGMKLEQYLQYAGTDIAKLREQYRETAEKNVKTDLMLEEVAKAENIKVEGKDLDAEVAAMAAAYGATPQQVQKIIKEQGRIGDLAASVLRKKTAQFIIDNIAE